MSDIKLFRIGAGSVSELTGTTDTVEKSVQILFESNLEQLLGVRFLATEFTTTHGGRIDTLGLDENGCPVILEYKRASNENVINQGLFYLDWLMDHRKDFQWLDLHRFRSGLLRAILAIKETGYGSDTQRRVQAGCGSHRAHQRPDKASGCV